MVSIRATDYVCDDRRYKNMTTDLLSWTRLSRVKLLMKIMQFRLDMNLLN